LSHYSKLSTVAQARETQGECFAALKILINEYAKTRTSGWSGISYEIPLGTALEGLHRTKEVKTRTGTKKVPVHPSRPSGRIEVFGPGEIEFIKADERPFDKYKETLEPYSKGQMVPIKDVTTLRTNAKSCITAMWEVVQRFSAPLTKRRTTALAYASKKGKGTINLTKQSWDDLLELIRHKKDRKEVALFSPLPLEIKSASKIMGAEEINQKERAVSGLLLLSELRKCDWRSDIAWREYHAFFGTPGGKYDSIYAPLEIESHREADDDEDTVWRDSSGGV